nr:RNA-directed DNA polymerase, eukaryota, reverse transcriptase zinc-binding domain protein [Tanacetum cinerariifolium]
MNDNEGVNIIKVTYKPVDKGDKTKMNLNEGDKTKNGMENEQMVDKGSPKTGWNIQHDIIDSIRKSANKFSILMNDSDEVSDKRKNNDANIEEDDVYEEEAMVLPLIDFMDFKIANWNVRGLRKVSKQNAVKNMIHGENLNVCAVLESKLKELWLDGTGTRFNVGFCILLIRLCCVWWRVMGNEELCDVHRRAHVVFLPYGISDYSPVVLTCSKSLKTTNRSFRGIAILKEYPIALEDEEKLMFQRDKVEWLNDGDRNSAYFHKECLDLDPSIFHNKINSQEANDMIGEVSNVEIKVAMYSIDDNKAPGPNG